MDPHRRVKGQKGSSSVETTRIFSFNSFKVAATAISSSHKSRLSVIVSSEDDVLTVVLDDLSRKRVICKSARKYKGSLNYWTQDPIVSAPLRRLRPFPRKDKEMALTRRLRGSRKRGRKHVSPLPYLEFPVAKSSGFLFGNK